MNRYKIVGYCRSLEALTTEVCRVIDNDLRWAPVGSPFTKDTLWFQALVFNS